MAERPLRILQVLRAPVGGLFRHVGDLTQGLADRGHEVGVVVDSISSDSLTAERLDGLRPAATLGIHSMPMPRVIGAGDITTPLRLRRLADELGIEVLHGHGAKGGLNARLVAFGAKQRVALCTPHGGVLHFGRGSPGGLVFRNFERVLLPITSAMIFESEFARRSFHGLIGVPRCPDPVIHNGLKPSEFEPIAPGPGAADFVFIGEFRALKGIQVLLEALVEVRAPDGRPASLVMAGNGPDFETFDQRINELRLRERVTLLGVQPARPTLARGRCAIVPSLKESLPYVVLEAAAAGRPVIATSVGGIAEIFGPAAASLVPAGDVMALRAAMQSFMDSPAAADAEMRVRLAYVREHFSVDRMVGDIEALYRQALGRQ